MKKLLLLLCLIFKVFVGGLSTQTVAQTVDEVLVYADYLYQTGNYNGAIKEYQRVAYFNGAQNYCLIQEKLGLCFFEKGQYTQAINFFDYAKEYCISDSSVNELTLRKSLCYILEQKYKLALAELVLVPMPSSAYFEKKANTYFGVCYFGLGNHRLAQQYFDLAVGENTTAKYTIDSLFAKNRYLTKPSPRLAMVLSAIVPGAGQVYSGKWFNGANSLTLNSGLVLLTIVMINHYTYIDAILTVLPWFLRYYQGGIVNAGKMATHKRNLRRQKIYSEIMEVIFDK